MTKLKHLLDTFTPQHYSLTLDLTHAEEKSFSGTVIISGESTGESISLHAKDLTIHSALIAISQLSFLMVNLMNCGYRARNYPVANTLFASTFPAPSPMPCTDYIHVISRMMA